MAAIIGALRANLSASIAQFQSDLGQAADSLKKFAKNAKSISRELTETGKTMAEAISLPLIALGYESLKAAQDARSALAQVQASIISTGNASGKSAEQLEETATGLRNISTFSRADILRGVTANLLVFGNVQGDVFTKAQKLIIDYATKMQVDLPTATLKWGRALNDPIKGITALSKAGVSFTSTQKELFKSLVQSGHGIEAQNLILDEGIKKFGGSAQAERDATPTAEMKNKWEDFTENIGTKLIPALTFFTKLLSDVFDWFSRLSPMTQEIVIGIGLFATTLGPLLIGLGTLLKLGAELARVLASVFTWIAGLEAVTVGWVVALAAIAIALVIFWRSIVDILHGDFAKAWEDAKKTASDIAASIKSTFSSMTPPTPGAIAAAPGAGGKPPPQNFNQDDEADIKKRASAALEFGRSIDAMNQKIANGLGTLQLPKATEQANALNAEIDAFVKKAQDAGINTDKWSGQIAALRAKITELQKVGLAQEAEKFGQAVDADAVAVAKFARGSLPPLEEKLDGIKTQYDQLKNKIENEITANAELAKSNDDAAKHMAELKQQLVDLATAHEKATQAAMAQAHFESLLADLQSKQNQADIGASIQDTQNARGDNGFVSQAQSDMQTATRDLQAQQNAAAQKLIQLEAAREELIRNNMNNENDLQIANLQKEIDLQTTLSDLVNNTTAAQILAQQKLEDAYKSFSSSISSSLLQMTTDFKGGMKGLLTSLTSLLTQVFIKPLTDEIGNYVATAIKSLLSSIGGGGAAGSTDWGSTISAAASAFKGLFADGGTINPGEWGIVGENGPEPVFGGLTGKTVISNSDARKMGGVTVNQYISTPDANSFRAGHRQIARQTKQGLGIT